MEFHNRVSINTPPRNEAFSVLSKAKGRMQRDVAMTGIWARLLGLLNYLAIPFGYYWINNIKMPYVWQQIEKDFRSLYLLK